MQIPSGFVLSRQIPENRSPHRLRFSQRRNWKLPATAGRKAGGRIRARESRPNELNKVKDQFRLAP